MTEVAALDVVCHDILPVFLKAPRIRFLVHTINRRRA